VLARFGKTAEPLGATNLALAQRGGGCQLLQSDNLPHNTVA